MRSLSIFALLAASASLASATTVAFQCSPVEQQAIASGVNLGSSQVTCGGFSAPSGFDITNISYSFDGSFQDAQVNGNHQLTFTVVNALFGSLDFTTGSHPSISLATGALGSTLDASAQTFTVTVANTVGGNNLPNSASYAVYGTYTYEAQQQSGVPEPSTLALVGGVLVLAGIRKFRS